MSTFARSFVFGVLVVASFAVGVSAEDAKTVKVFILAGQSNMEGKANNSLLEHQAAPVSGNVAGSTAGYFQFDRVGVNNPVKAQHNNTPLSPEGQLQARHFLQNFLR